MKRVAELLSPAGGSSLPWLARLDDGQVWLVKFAGAGPGRDALLAEFIANGLARSWGLPVPEATAVCLDVEVPRAGTDEFWDVLDASAGENLAIRIIPDAEPLIPSDELPHDTLESLVSFDTLLANWDRTALSANLMRDPAGKIWWIDHGSCRFLHHLSTHEPLSLPTNHFMWGHEDVLAKRTLPRLEPAALESIVDRAPTAWLQPRATHASLGQRLAEYLGRYTK